MAAVYWRWMFQAEIGLCSSKIDPTIIQQNYEHAAYERYWTISISLGLFY